ncbi:MAG TPA: ABC transporter ATP-binding protein [Acidimicrobiales bacterium]|nr:ABC transporter ATP-binding protein [Acidimicrobiales bacterium]
MTVLDDDHPTDDRSPAAGTAATADPSATPVPAVRVQNLVKHFRRDDGSTVNAVDDVSIEVAPGEFMVLLGPSGCGKTTLLRSIAGLEQPASGTIEIGGEVVFSPVGSIDVPPERRNVNMIFQSYALWPHMTALQNVSYPLECAHVPKPERRERAESALAMVGIPELGGQHPGQMSGGQQQRVALARALVSNERLVLFDEPLSNVDAKVREQLRFELLSMQRELGFAAVYVTHDQIEAMELAHRIAVMQEGRVAQIGPPRTIYDEPRSYYVANFIGTTNVFAGVVTGHDDSRDLLTLDSDLGPVEAVAGSSEIRPGSDATLVCRPERCTLSTQEPEGPNRWSAEVVASRFVGSHTEHALMVGTSRFRVWRADHDIYEEGSSVWISVPPRDLRCLPTEQDVDNDGDS